MKITGIAVVTLAATFVSSISLAAVVTNTNDDGAGSLRAAIAAASPGETITFDAAVTGSIVLTSGSLDISENLVINGPGSSVLAISGNDLSRVFFVDIGATVVIRDLSITNGLIDDEGGGLRNDGILTLEDMHFSQNQAVDASGGALVNQGTMIIRDSVFENNEAQSGGAIFNVTGADLTAERLLVQNNESSGGGGGIFSTGSLQLSDSTVTGNTVTNNNGAGGGVFVTNDNASAELINVTISGNQVVGTDGFGGGLTGANFHQGIFLTNVTIADNSAANGGGVASFNVSSGDNLTLVNAIVANNPVGGDCQGAFIVDGGNNIVADNSCSFSGGQDPLLGSLADNGGPTPTHALLSGSPAINQGNPAACPPADQRGTARQGVCDIGAYEFLATPGTVQFSAATYEVNENGGSFQVTVTRTGGGDGEVSVQFSTADGSATAGLDYEAVDQVVTFADGDMANKIVAIPILSDNAIESDETVNLSLADPQGGVALGATSAAVLTIHDEPSGPLTDEACDNRIDDDGDGAVDCNDSDCDAAEICQGIDDGDGDGDGDDDDDGDDDGEDVEGDGGCSLSPSRNAAPASWLGFGALLTLASLGWARLRNPR